ncbi:type II secretion system protein [Kribbella sp. VKM Ac-2566]|uniref:type II secretion system protein n=1 Tax=Kribbella sp. VKM Ac-2566 TaxID=2512218 RepID=UPI0010639116|nr:prepilin-type N-terminal cleavage/methylation domain-containing protein [Kribbella sp. VKM Ac-2566]TDW91617.1 general secretion pathway protein G [Kribbella sp. VKM Ac-2566]
MLNRIHEARKNESGFTLIELLMVIIILGVLSGIVVFAVNGIQDRGAESACKTDVKTVAVAAEAAYAQNEAYPLTMTALVASGFLHSEAASVEYAATATAITTLQGAATSKCAGFKG